MCILKPLAMWTVREPRVGRGGERLSQLRGFQSESKRNENRKLFMDGFTKLAFLLKKKRLSQPINHHSK